MAKKKTHEEWIKGDSDKAEWALGYLERKRYFDRGRVGQFIAENVIDRAIYGLKTLDKDKDGKDKIIKLRKAWSQSLQLKKPGYRSYSFIMPKTIGTKLSNMAGNEHLNSFLARLIIEAESDLSSFKNTYTKTHKSQLKAVKAKHQKEKDDLKQEYKQKLENKTNAIKAKYSHPYKREIDKTQKMRKIEAERKRLATELSLAKMEVFRAHAQLETAGLKDVPLSPKEELSAQKEFEIDAAHLEKSSTLAEPQAY